MMRDLLLLAGSIGMAAAGAALCLESWQRLDRRIFAGLIAAAVTVSLFSVIAWAATAIARIAPPPLALGFIAALAVLFAQRLYRELQAPPYGEPR